MKSPLRAGLEIKLSFATLAPRQCNYTFGFKGASVLPAMYFGSVFGFTTNYSFTFEKSIRFLQIFRNLIPPDVLLIFIQLQRLKFCSHSSF